MIALSYAHGDRIPFLSVNTCVHELLHALMQDIFVSRPKWYESDGREFRTDSYATGLWLFRDGAAIRQSAQACLDRLRSGPLCEHHRIRSQGHKSHWAPSVVPTRPPVGRVAVTRQGFSTLESGSRGWSSDG